MGSISAGFKIIINKIVLYFKICFFLHILSPYMQNGFYGIRKDGKKYLIEKGVPMLFVFSLHKEHCKRGGY